MIYPAWPLYLYTNPQLGKFLLDALFSYQATGRYPEKFAIHDLGTHYPNATGHDDASEEKMPVQESGGMLIMALSYARATGDNSQLVKYVFGTFCLTFNHTQTSVGRTFGSMDTISYFRLTHSGPPAQYG